MPALVLQYEKTIQVEISGEILHLWKKGNSTRKF
jgi:hypothetical protein